MLDEFVPSKPEPKAPTGPGRPPASNIPDVDAGLSDEDFAKQLQAGMADLLGGLETSPEMASQFESMLKELGGAAGLGDMAELVGASDSATTKDPVAKKVASSTGKTAAAGSTTEESFQETIQKTMERMRTSGDQATAAAASDNSDDLMAEMMKAMQASGLGEGEEGEEEFSKMLLGMMEQLTNKEILYEPMKELDNKFPDWMTNNEAKVDASDLKRYKEQQGFVKEIVDRFERKGYSDDNASDREYIVERMQKVCFDLLFEYIKLISTDASSRVATTGSCRRYGSSSRSIWSARRRLPTAIDYCISNYSPANVNSSP